MADATLLFGMGAAKAGTSWLYRYLCAHPDCHLRTIKELHFFDAIDEGREAEQLRMLAERRRKLARRRADAADDANRARRIAEIEEYEGVLASADQGQYLSFLNRGRGTGVSLIPAGQRPLRPMAAKAGLPHRSGARPAQGKAPRPEQGAAPDAAIPPRAWPDRNDRSHPGRR